jgi:PAS domain S-box-containing protein
MVMVDSAGRIGAANTEIERMFDYRREELIGKSVDILFRNAFVCLSRRPSTSSRLGAQSVYPGHSIR